jgi:hypothetical protein
MCHTTCAPQTECQGPVKGYILTDAQEWSTGTAVVIHYELARKWI